MCAPPRTAHPRTIPYCRDGIKANKASKCAQKIKVSVTNKGAFLTKESGGDMLYHIPGIVFHCLVMGKNSAWSKKQMAVLMSRITPEDGKPATHLKVHTIEFPKKKNAALMFKAFVKLMEYLRESQKGRTFSEQDNAENNHDAAPDNEDDEYLSIMTSGPL